MAVLAGCAAGGTDAPVAVVERVVDGDTIVVTVGGDRERVRLIGIDTPEIAHEAFGDRAATPDECYGPEAAARLAGLLPPGSQVRLERDVVARDDYGRLLAYVFLGDQLVNLDLVREGYAVPMTIEPNSALASGFVGAAAEAERHERGLWGRCVAE
jgi:micrococcal nuclease